MNRVCSVFAVLALAASAAACKEGGTVSVRALTFRGVRQVDVARLKGVLATRENDRVPVVGWHTPWGKKNAFDRARVDADLKRIEAFYADRGYPDARVTSVDVKLNAAEDAVDVVLTIDEGQPVKVAAVDFRGFDVVPADHLAQVTRQMALVVGQARDRQAVTTAHESAVNELRDHGYPYARVATDENDGASGKDATIVFTAEPGRLAHFGAVQVTGNASVSNRAIERQLTFKPGDVYRRSLVQESQRRLYSMELFQFVNIESLDPQQQQQPADVNTRVTVAEGKHQRVNFGVGYGTEEKARADGEYHHVNFLGGARSAGARARWSSLDRGLRLDLTQPYFLGPHVSLGGEAQKWYTYTPSYGSIVTGLKATLLHRESQNFSWAVSISSERNDSSISQEALGDPLLYADLIALGLDPTTGHQEGVLRAFGVDIRRTTADNLLNARRGYQFALHAEDAGLLPGTFNFNAMSVDARHYIPVSGRLVIANRMGFGAIKAAGGNPAQVPFSKKYFLGGATSIRGWGRYEVSPLGGSGLPIGGDSMVAFSSEARLSLRGNLGAVGFIDAGNVWAGDWRIRLDDLRYAVGPGLRYQTPVGPIRLDVGYQLNQVQGLRLNGAPQARRWRIHFSIGQAF